MLILSVLSIFLAVIPLVVGIPCTNPSVRKEWRAFNTQEKTAWIQAVTVRVKRHCTGFRGSVNGVAFSACQSCHTTRL